MKQNKSQAKAAQTVILNGSNLALKAMEQGLFQGGNAEAVVEIKKFLTALKTGAEKVLGVKNANA